MDLVSLGNDAALLRELVQAQHALLRAQPALAEVLATAVQEAQRLTGAQGAAVLCVEGETLVYGWAGGLAQLATGERVALDGSLAALALREGRARVADTAGLAATGAAGVYGRLGVRSLVVAPLCHAGCSLGALELVADVPDAFGRWHAAVLEALALAVGAALASARAAQREAALAQRLRDAEARFGAFMDHSPTVAFMKDVDGHYVYGNLGLCRLFGAHPAGLAGRTDFDFLSPEAAEGVRDSDAAVLAAGRALVRAEDVLLGGDGTAHHWLATRFPFVDSRGQRFVGGVAVDISERVSARQELERQAAVLRSFYDHAPFMMGLVEVVDGQLRLASVNARAADMAGRQPAEMVGLTATELGVPDAVQAEVLARLRAVAGHQEPVRLDLEQATPGGARRSLRVTLGWVPRAPGRPLQACFVAEVLAETPRSVPRPLRALAR